MQKGRLWRPLRFACSLARRVILKGVHAADALAAGTQAVAVDETVARREIDLVDAAPLLVEQVAEVQHVEREAGLVALEEAG
ncbi:MAG: hypothetical protein Q8M96_16380, partial [Rubrivivax sp.]|nr:hypothetical protein [Rubrivivax sp.]